MKLVGISGSLAGFKTLKVVHEVLVAAKKVDPAIETEIIDIKEFDIEFVNGSPLSYYNDDTQNVVHKILSADLLVIGTPIYQASISGALKNLLDHLPIGAFKGKIVGYVSNGGSTKHSIVPEYHLAPILQYLEAITPTKNVFVHSDHFDDDSDIISPDIYRRLEKLAQEMVILQKKISND